MKPLARWSLSVGLTAAGVWFAARGVSWDGFFQSLRRPDVLGGLALVPVFLGAEYVLRTARWSLLMGGGRGYFPVVAAAFFLNAVLPFRAGEAARVYWSHRRSGRPVPACVSALAVDRLGDALALFGVFAVFFFFSGGHSVAGRKIGFFVLALGGALAGLTVALRRPDGLRRLFAPAGAPALWVRVLDGFLAGVAPLRSPRVAAAVALLSAGLWAVNVALFWCVGSVFGLALTPSQAGGVLAAIALGVALPSTPGFVGVYEAAGVLMLGSLGIDKERALAFVLSLHAAQILSTALWGGPSLLALARREGTDSRPRSGIDKIPTPS